MGVAKGEVEHHRSTRSCQCAVTAWADLGWLIQAVTFTLVNVVNRPDKQCVISFGHKDNVVVDKKYKKHVLHV